MKWSQETCHVLNEVLFPGEGKYLFLLKELLSALYKMQWFFCVPLLQLGGCGAFAVHSGFVDTQW